MSRRVWDSNCTQPFFFPCPTTKRKQAVGHMRLQFAQVYFCIKNTGKILHGQASKVVVIKLIALVLKSLLRFVPGCHIFLLQCSRYKQNHRCLFA